MALISVLLSAVYRVNRIITKFQLSLEELHGKWPQLSIGPWHTFTVTSNLNLVLSFLDILLPDTHFIPICLTLWSNMCWTEQSFTSMFWRQWSWNFLYQSNGTVLCLHSSLMKWLFKFEIILLKCFECKLIVQKMKWGSLHVWWSLCQRSTRAKVQMWHSGRV